MDKTYSTIIEGMTCGNCALTISKMLEKKGASNVSANAASGEVSFSMPEAMDVDVVYDVIDDLGYHVVRDDAAGHAAHEHEGSDNETKLLLLCVALTVPLLLHMFVSWPVLHNPWLQLALATPVYVIGLMIFGKSALRSLKHRLPNMDVLIMLGASAAYIYSLIGLLFIPGQSHNYLFFETTASIITLVMFGNWLEHRTVKSTTVAIDALVKLQPQFAKLVMTDSIGKETVVELESKFVKAGDVVLVNNGDSIPVDGAIVSGEAQVDERMISGESLPVHKKAGDAVVGGTLVADGNLRVQATSVGSASVLSSIIRMVREAQGNKPPLQKLADKISAIFVPAVLGIALLTFIVNYVSGQTFSESMMRSIAVMVISCPCAMGLATPAAVAVGLGRAARNGILVKGGDTLEQLKKIKQIVFDKTGTLTTGRLHIEQYKAVGMEEEQFRSVVASIEKHSSHPIARSVTAEWSDAPNTIFREVSEVRGKGMQATDSEGNNWKLGSYNWLHRGAKQDTDFELYLYRNDVYAGGLNISDTLRADATETIAELKRMGYETILLSGDKERKCRQVADQVGIDTMYAEHTPEQKNKVLDDLMAKAPTAMVGDGINDAPALAKATVGISLSESTQIAIQSASIILSGNQLGMLPQAIRLGIYTEQTIRQNLFWAFLYNIIAIPVAAFGYLSPTWGAGVMALSDVILVANSLRLRFRRLR